MMRKISEKLRGQWIIARASAPPGRVAIEIWKIHQGRLAATRGRAVIRPIVCDHATCMSPHASTTWIGYEHMPPRAPNAAITTRVPSKGTMWATLAFTLPPPSEPSMSRLPRPTPNISRVRSNMQHSPLVAVIDDDESVRESLLDLLEVFRYSAVTFASAREFLESPRLADAHCLLLDISMPEMNGIDRKSVV